MAAAFFSKKPSFGKEPKGESQNVLGGVRTMKDDLEEAQHSKQETVLPQAKEQEVKSNFPQNGVFQRAVNPFSEEGEKILETKAKVAGEQPGNPFGVVSERKNGPASDVLQSPSLKNGLSGIVSDGGEIRVNQPVKKNNDIFLAGVVGVLSLALISGGVFYFFSQRNQAEPEMPTPPAPLSSPDVISVVPEKVPESAPQESPFALDKPNYLSFNTETVSPEDIKNTLFQTALRVKTANIAKPIEFLVTDQNNNPLAFSRFAFLSKLDIAPDVLSLIDEPFSLYVYNDASRVHLGLALAFKDASAAASAIAKAETSLPYIFQALIFESDIQIPANASFNSGTYNQFTIRFANFGSSQNVSFDYTEDGTQWFIGTSKNTLRAILDTYAK